MKEALVSALVSTMSEAFMGFLAYLKTNPGPAMPFSAWELPLTFVRLLTTVILVVGITNDATRMVSAQISQQPPATCRAARELMGRPLPRITMSACTNYMPREI